MFKVLYTGAFRFPDGDAAALRVYNVAKLIEGSGAKVTFAGWEGSTKREYEFDHHECFSQAEFRVGQKNKIYRLFGFLLRGHRTFRWLFNRPFDAVVLYNPPALFAASILVLSRFKGFKVLLDSTEWYESSHLPGGRFGLAALENWCRMKVIYPLFDNVICISHFLEVHFSSSANTLWLPPLLPDPGLPAPRELTSLETIRFAYAGDMGLKDDLTRFVLQMDDLERLSGRRIELHIAGVDSDVFHSIFAKITGKSLTAKNSVICYGRISREDVLDLYDRCHFSVFFRQQQRYALAGFATKSVESLSRGCPVVTNDVGDLGSILTSGVDAYIVQGDESLDTLGRSLASLTTETYAAMRLSAYNLYSRQFTVAANTGRFQVFYDGVGMNLDGGGSQ